MPFFDENEFSLLKEPKQYGNPTGRPDPSVDIPTAPNAPKERSIMDIVNASLLGGSVGMASARDPMAGYKVMEAMRGRELQQKKLEQDEEQEAYKNIENIFKVTEKFDDKEAAAKFVRAAVKASPALEKRFGGLIGDESFKLKVGDKNEIVIETEVKEDEVKMPSGKVLPAGTYKLTYDAESFKPGKNPVPRKIETGTPQKKSEDKSPTMSQIEARAIISKVTNPDTGEVDDKKLFDTIKDLKTTPQGADSRIFDHFVKKNKGDEDAAVKEYRGYITGIAAARTAGGETGRLGVRSGEPYQQTEEDIARRRAEGSTEGRPLEASTQQALAALSSLENSIDVLEKNFDKEFLGPVKGTSTAFEARRRVGSYVGSPAGKKETTFRQTLSNISDQLLRARSGAQINEQEYARLSRLLPKATDEEDVYKAGVERFRKEMQQLKSERTKYGVTPRGQIDRGAPSSGTRPPQSEIEAAKKRLGIK